MKDTVSNIGCAVCRGNIEAYVDNLSKSDGFLHVGDARIHLRTQPTVSATSKCSSTKIMPAFLVDKCVEVSGKREALISLSQQEKRLRQEGAYLACRPPLQKIHEAHEPHGVRDNDKLEEAVQDMSFRHKKIKFQQEQNSIALQEMEQMKHTESTAMEESLHKQIVLQSRQVDAWALSIDNFAQKLKQFQNYAFLVPSQQQLELRQKCAILETSHNQTFMQLDALLRQQHVDELKCNVFLDRSSLEKQSEAHNRRCYTQTMIKDSHHNLKQRIGILFALQNALMQAYPSFCTVHVNKHTRHIRQLHNYIAKSASSPLIALIEVRYALCTW